MSSGIRISIIALSTLLVFPLVGYLIWIIFREESFVNIFQEKENIYTQSILGIIVGLSSANLGWQIINSKLLNTSLKKYEDLTQALELNLLGIILISICAGVGEEILFRGVIQDFLGIPITSILFVAIHGYLNPKDWRISIYGIYMTAVIMLLGLLHEKTGIYTVMTSTHSNRHFPIKKADYYFNILTALSIPETN